MPELRRRPGRRAGSIALAALAAAFAAALAALPAALAAQPLLSLPIRCTLGEDCFVQNYVDRDPGPGRRDHACGHLSYNGHRGTDFRVLDLAQMARGVPVLAAAAGTVAAVRDGEPDVSMRERDAASLAGREAGNGVRITHGDGWETQYSHLKRGSVRVRVGQQVAAGEELGLVGLSGKTEFPHVDFVVRHHGEIVDPFAPSASAACGPQPRTLWRPELADELRYRPVGLLLAGWVGEEAERGKAERGDYRDPVGPRAPVLAFFFEVFGPRVGDREVVELIAPSGRIFARRDTPMDRSVAVRFGYVGKRRGDDEWASGTYVARYRLERDGVVILSATRELDLR